MICAPADVCYNKVNLNLKLFMFKKANDFLEKNKSVFIVSILLNALFLVVVSIFINVFYGVSFLAPANSWSGRNDSQASLSPKETEERLVVDVVGKSNPAVVSIVATASISQISEEQRRMFDFFAPYLDLDIPRDGTTRQVGAGSGFFVSSDGLVVTNRHVVDNDSLDYAVVTSDGTRLDAEVIAKDPIYDVAILKVEITDATFLEFGDSDQIALGSSVIAIGNALAEFSNSVTKGIVSGLSRSVVARGNVGQTELLENVIQTDAGINPGNSGGPLLDLEGKVIGVNVAVAVGSENIGFALPANLVSRIVRSVKEEGRIVRPFIGVRYVALNEQVAASRGLSVSQGALITSDIVSSPAIVPDSPAEKAGLRAGDIIIEFGGRKITDSTSLQKLTREAEVGDEVDVKILRDGNEETITLVLEEAPDNL